MGWERGLARSRRTVPRERGCKRNDHAVVPMGNSEVAQGVSREGEAGFSRREARARSWDLYPAMMAGLVRMSAGR